MVGSWPSSAVGGWPRTKRLFDLREFALCGSIIGERRNYPERPPTAGTHRHCYIGGCPEVVFSVFFTP